ncbi:MAG: fibronectin type III domain-containing protein [Planctomycetota bacterium]
MADQGTSFGQLMANHGEKAAIILSGLGLLAFAIMMITGGSTELNPDDFKSAVKAMEKDLEGDNPRQSPRPDFAGPIAAAIDPATEYPRTGFGAARTWVPTEMQLIAPFSEQKGAPPTKLTVTKARFGEVTVEWVPSRNTELAYYLVKCWKIEDPEPTDNNQRAGHQMVQQRGNEDRAVVQFKGLTDNQTYKIRVKCFMRDNKPVDFTGNPSQYQDDTHLVIEVTPVGVEKTLPTPTSCNIVDAGLTGVVLQWDDLMKFWANEERESFEFAASDKVYVQLVRRIGKETEWKPVKECDPVAHPELLMGGYPLKEFCEKFKGYTDLNIAPEQDLRYALRLFHIEAWPDGNGKAFDSPDLRKEIKDKSYRGTLVDIPMAELDRNGKPVMAGNPPAPKAWKTYTVFSSQVEFDKVVNLPNRAVFECTRATMDSAKPDGPGSTATIAVTRYFKLGNNWERLTANFTVSLSGTKKLGDVARPDRVGTEEFRAWARAHDYDSRATFDFSTPYELVAVYDCRALGAGDADIQTWKYAELEDTTDRRTWPIRLFEGGLGGPGAGQRQGNGSGLTPARRLQASRDLKAIDKTNLADLKTFSAKWGVRFITEPMKKRAAYLERFPHNQLRQLEEEADGLEKLEAEWQTIQKDYPIGSRRSVYMRKNLITKEFDSGHGQSFYGDIRGIPALLAIIKAQPTVDKDGAGEAWEELIAAFKSSSTGSRLKELGISIPMDLYELPPAGEERVKFIKENMDRLFAALERHYLE